ncbi:MAG TPA: hypothetical protein VJJ83_03445 [Candidatus Babeliales bacterium]|nr:hypothetical protein [Candidatus Babeliales bacterium]
MKYSKDNLLRIALLAVGVCLLPSYLVASHAARVTDPLAVHRFNKGNDETCEISQFAEYHQVKREFRSVAGTWSPLDFVRHSGSFETCSIEPCGFLAEVGRPKDATTKLTSDAGASAGTAKAAAGRPLAPAMSAAADCPAVSAAPSASSWCAAPVKMGVVTVVAAAAFIAYKQDKCTIS